jgi:hypothetical protein
MHIISCILFIISMAIVSVSHATPPSIYWTSSPVRPNETVVIAGGGLSATKAQLCYDSSCNTPVSASQQPKGKGRGRKREIWQWRDLRGEI